MDTLPSRNGHTPGPVRLVPHRYRHLPQGEAITRYSQVVNPLNCLPELDVARQRLDEFLTKYEQQYEVLEQWARAYGTEYQVPPPRLRPLYPEQVLEFIKRIVDTAETIQHMYEVDTVGRSLRQRLVLQLGQAVQEALDGVPTLTQEEREAVWTAVVAKWSEVVV